MNLIRIQIPSSFPLTADFMVWKFNVSVYWWNGHRHNQSSMSGFVLQAFHFWHIHTQRKKNIFGKAKPLHFTKTNLWALRDQFLFFFFSLLHIILKFYSHTINLNDAYYRWLYTIQMSTIEMKRIKKGNKWRKGRAKQKMPLTHANTRQIETKTLSARYANCMNFTFTNWITWIFLVEWERVMVGRELAL